MNSEHGSGTMSDGVVSGNKVIGTFKAEIQGQSMDLQMDGTIDGDKMTGTLSGTGLPPLTFTATKDK